MELNAPVTTVRDLVAGMQREMAEGELSPAHACAMLEKLTALLGNCLEEIREADHEFNIVLLQCLEQGEAANRARIRAECTSEYMRKRVAKDTKELADSLIGTLKYVLRSHESEQRHLSGRYA